jgi:glycerol-3-phosphate cytidylyltransferase
MESIFSFGLEMKNKIKTREELKKIVFVLKKRGKIVGFTSGAFDILHSGHVDYLEKAKKECDILVVGVNSDNSIKEYKDPLKPIINEKDRIKLIAGLEAVDYTFIFDEQKNKKNILTLKPSLYIKAGDYSLNELTSRKHIEKIGGKVMLIPLVENISTTNIIERVIKKYNNIPQTLYYPKESEKAKAIFLDRDGTINEPIDYLHEPKKFKLKKGIIEILQKYFEEGYKLVVITNQPGIGFGYYPVEDFFKVNKEMLSQLSHHGIMIDKIYFCPHTQAENCKCRKPEIGLVKRAEKELNLDLKQCIFMGDKESDMECGRRAGCKTILVE